MHARSSRRPVEMAQWAEQHGVPVVTLEERGAERVEPVATREHGPRSLGTSAPSRHDPCAAAPVARSVAHRGGHRRDRHPQRRSAAVLGGIGHRSEEHAAHGKDWVNRGVVMDECVGTLLEAWTGDPFEYRGTTVRVTPKPHSETVPFMLRGELEAHGTRHAARFLADLLRRVDARAGGVLHGTVRAAGLGGSGDHAAGRVLSSVHRRRPGRGVGRARWVPAARGDGVLGVPEHRAQVRTVHNTAATVDELRAQGTYRFMTPGEAGGGGDRRRHLLVQPPPALWWNADRRGVGDVGAMGRQGRAGEWGM